jgi:hypothetical protein
MDVDPREGNEKERRLGDMHFYRIKKE